MSGISDIIKLEGTAKSSPDLQHSGLISPQPCWIFIAFYIKHCIVLKYYKVYIHPWKQILTYSSSLKLNSL